MASGLRDFGMTFASRIAMVLIGLATQSCLAWVLGPGGRGSYAVCFLFATVLGICIVVGYDLPALYFVASKKFSVSEGVVHALIYAGIGSALAVGVGLLMMRMPLPFLQKASTRAFHLSLVFLPAAVYSYTFLQLLTSVREFGWFAILQTAGAVTMLGATLVFVWGLSWGPEGALLANIVAAVVTLAGTLVVLHAKHRLRWCRPSLAKLKAMLSYGARFYVGKISNLVNFQVGTIILALFATREEVGLFAVAAALTGRTMMIPDTLSGILIPRVAGNQAGVRRVVAICARLSLVICGGLLLILSVFARPLIALLFSPAFLPAVPLIWILAAGFLLRAPSKVLISYLVGSDHPGAVSAAMAAAIAVNVALVWALLPILHLPAAAIGLAGSYVVSAGIIAWCYCHFGQVSLSDLLHFRRSDWAPLLRPLRRLPAQARDRADPAE